MNIHSVDEGNCYRFSNNASKLDNPLHGVVVMVLEKFSLTGTCRIIDIQTNAKQMVHRNYLAEMGRDLTDNDRVAAAGIAVEYNLLTAFKKSINIDDIVMPGTVEEADEILLNEFVAMRVVPMLYEVLPLLLQRDVGKNNRVVITPTDVKRFVDKFSGMPRGLPIEDYCSAVPSVLREAGCTLPFLENPHQVTGGSIFVIVNASDIISSLKALHKENKERAGHSPGDKKRIEFLRDLGALLKEHNAEILFANAQGAGSFMVGDWHLATSDSDLVPGTENYGFTTAEKAIDRINHGLGEDDD